MHTSHTSTLGAALAAAAPALILFGAATAHAAGSDYYFESPSGNIVCDLTDQGRGSAHLACSIGDYTYQAPINGETQQPCSDLPNFFNLEQGMQPLIVCDLGGQIRADNLHGAGLRTLGYGQTQSAGAITCDSEPTGMTCTDASTGHFFRVARESYQLG